MPTLNRLRLTPTFTGPVSTVRLVIIAALFAGGVACTTSVGVESQFPTPVISSIPLRMGVHFGESLKNFQYNEVIPQQSKWEIKLGNANVALFEPMLGAMFTTVVEIEQFPPPAGKHADLQAIIQPTIEKFEFDLPRDPKNKFVEAWVQYRMNLYETDGTLIASWAISGYGKSQNSGLGPGKALRRATIRAMRDAGVVLVTEFGRDPKVAEWLDEEQADEREGFTIARPED